MIQIEQNTHWMVLNPQHELIQIKVYQLSPNKKVVKKLCCIIDLRDQNKMFGLFDEVEEVIEIVKNNENYSLDFDERTLKVYWQVEAFGYCKTIEEVILMEEEAIGRMEYLQIQNQILKKTLNSYQIPALINPNFQPQNQPSIKYIDLDQSQSEELMGEVTIINCKKLKSKYFPSNNNIKKIKPINKKKFLKSHGKPSKKRKVQTFQENTLLKFVNKQKNKAKQQISIKNKSIRTNIASQKNNTIKTKNKRNMQICKNNDEIKRLKIGDLMRIQYKNGDHYFGQVFRNMPHGKGTYCSQANGTYDGKWVRGESEGFGVSIDINGNKHQGMYKFDKKNGWGIDEYVNGERYEGNFVNDDKNGFGKYFFINGDVYEGDWKNDMFHGEGTQFYANGCIFKGKWVNDEKDGTGIFESMCGQKFQQTWKKGQLVRQSLIKE